MFNVNQFSTTHHYYTDCDGKRLCRYRFHVFLVFTLTEIKWPGNQWRNCLSAHKHCAYLLAPKFLKMTIENRSDPPITCV